MRKPAFCICQNKDADQLCGDRIADQRLCFCHIDSTIPLLSKSERARFTNWPFQPCILPKSQTQLTILLVIFSII